MNAHNFSTEAAWAEPEALRRLLDIPGEPARTRVVVAMSGGVDSSVAAALTARAGFETVGITLQLYDQGLALARKGACCAGQDIYDAAQVAQKIGIPHYVLDYESRFKAQVMEDFADAYARGETPIPCVRCNQTVKFADLLRAAQDLGAAALVTGHYVRRAAGPNGPELHRAADQTRDQSYFLFATTAAQLDYLRFPLGGLSKDRTRALADALALPVAKKPDSQDICFVPDGDYASVVRRLRPDAARPGPIVHVDGRAMGHHEGVINFTVGQRRGLNLGHHEPLFVIRIDPKAATVVVGPREALATTTLRVTGLNWLYRHALAETAWPVLVKVRSMRPPVAGEVRRGDADGEAAVTLFTAEYGVAPGQACVFYDPDGEGTRVLGGGWIARQTGQP